MNIDNSVASLGEKLLQQQSNSLFFSGGDDFASKLTLGQVIKGKVMRHYEAGRYAVDFNGQEKVVDSQNPLRLGQMIEGKVRALGQQVEIQRINHAADDLSRVTKSVDQAELANSQFFQKQDKPLAFLKDFFSQRQANLSQNEAHLLKAMLARGASTKAVALAALAVKKAGVELTRESVGAVVELLTNKTTKTNLSLISLEVTRDVLVSTVNGSQQAIKELSDMLRTQSQDEFFDGNAFIGQTDLEDSGENPDRHQKESAFSLLNIQDDSAVNHRIMMLPVWMGDRLVEVKMAFFDQQSGGSGLDLNELPYKRVVFTLVLETLGAITVSAVMHGLHMRLSIAGESKDSINRLADYISTLKDAVSSMGWVVDEIEYVTIHESKDGFDPAVFSVVEHYITKDSISRTL